MERLMNQLEQTIVRLSKDEHFSVRNKDNYKNLDIAIRLMEIKQKDRVHYEMLEAFKKKNKTLMAIEENIKDLANTIKEMQD